MALFDNLRNKVNDAAKKAAQGVTNKAVDVVFPTLPETYEEFVALPLAKLSTPFDTAAMTVLAFCFYPEHPDLSIKMLNYLRGPRPLSPMELSFIKDRFRDKDYVPRSYFKGSTYKNDYIPEQPYTITPFENPYSYENEGYAKLFLNSGGADNPRYLMMRLAKDGKWYLWEQYILSDIRKPESENPWA